MSYKLEGFKVAQMHFVTGRQSAFRGKTLLRPPVQILSDSAQTPKYLRKEKNRDSYSFCAPKNTTVQGRLFTEPGSGLRPRFFFYIQDWKNHS